jgi:hypothetical protein
MNNQTVVVEILPQSGKLCKSMLCGVKLKDITNIITTKPTRIDGLSKKQTNKLKSLDLTTNDWLIIDILLNIFEPFFEVTKMLSGRKYELCCRKNFV